MSGGIEPVGSPPPSTYAEGGFVVLVRGGAAWVTINRPHKKNAITLEMLDALPTVLDDAVSVNACTAVVFSGAGEDAFCAGFDLGALAASDPTAVDAVVVRAYDALAGAAVPTIACIDGWCIGAGLELALCCDLRVCTPTSRFQLPAGKIGINYPRHGLRRIADAVGHAAARRIVVLSERLPADEAFRIGLVHEGAADAEEVATGWAATIHESNGDAVNGMRRTLGQLTLEDE